MSPILLPYFFNYCNIIKISLNYKENLCPFALNDIVSFNHFPVAEFLQPVENPILMGAKQAAGLICRKASDNQIYQGIFRNLLKIMKCNSIMKEIQKYQGIFRNLMQAIKGTLSQKVFEINPLNHS
jgi:hypothetical protein